MQSKDSSEYAIEIKNVSKNFIKSKNLGDFLKHPFKSEKIHAVKKLSLSIKKGELFGIIGLNGAGKTTLLKMISTILTPDSGRISVDNFDVVKDSADVRRTIGLVYGDERTFYWSLTGKQNLRFFASLHHIPRDKKYWHVEDILHLVGLGQWEDTRIDSYSTGMKHLLALARGLLGNPQILLLDEPTSGVDPIGTENILEMIRQLADSGKTVLWITHDLVGATKVCDRVALMDRGEVKVVVDDVRLKKIDLEPIFKKHMSSRSLI